MQIKNNYEEENGNKIIFYGFNFLRYTFIISTSEFENLKLRFFVDDLDI